MAAGRNMGKDPTSVKCADLRLATCTQLKRAMLNLSLDSLIGE
jgi:hypothetical protein